MRKCSGTGGSFQPEWVAAFNRNRWQLSPESVAGLRRNTQKGLAVEKSSALN